MISEIKNETRTAKGLRFNALNTRANNLQLAIENL